MGRFSGYSGNSLLASGTGVQFVCTDPLHDGQMESMVSSACCCLYGSILGGVYLRTFCNCSEVTALATRLRRG